MKTIMNLDTLETLEQIEEFLLGTQPVAFGIASTKQERYNWLQKTLIKWRYQTRNRRERGLLMRFMIRVSGYSPAQLKRLIKQQREAGKVIHRPARRNGFKRQYTDTYIRLLAKVDRLHGSPSGGVTKKLCERAFHRFDGSEYKRLSVISVAQVYLLRKTKHYQRQHLNHTKTNPTKVAIGERRKPHPQGQPGYIRIDTVHQGDLDKQKGVYHINAVDEVTQFEVLATVVGISERFLMPALAQLLAQFPFTLKGFHSDNGSEHVNHRVAGLLEKLRIEFTKSRSRHSNDNALAESKNAAVVRKLYGHMHIPKHWAGKINELNQKRGVSLSKLPSTLLLPSSRNG
jgi:transposase InsO family protein